MTNVTHPSVLSDRARFYYILLLGVVLASSTLLESPLTVTEGTWEKKVIDNSLEGADGTRLGDVNRDGFPDVVTGWEESGTVRVAFHPGHLDVAELWPSIAVGTASDVEDAVAADVDGDGATDIISASEGSTKTLSIHWAPRDQASLLMSEEWRTETIPVSVGRRWMFALPLDLDGRNGVDIVAGSKGQGAGITWFRPNNDPRDLGAWRTQDLYHGGWIMSLVGRDLDVDGDIDLLASDRRGPRRGILWLENPGIEGGNWPEHRIGPVDQFEVMFFDLADLDGDGLEDIVAATREGELLIYKRNAGAEPSWAASQIPAPNPAATGKAVAVGDIDCDGFNDLVVSHEGARQSPGIMVLYQHRTTGETTWVPSAISGNAGIKFDLVVLVDLDADGDLDVLTSEEKTIGVVWYENPGASATEKTGVCAPKKDAEARSWPRTDRD